MLNAEDDTEFSEDQMYVFRQAIKHVTYALKIYFESHACIMADRLRTSDYHLYNKSPTPEVTPYKVLYFTARI